VCAGHVVGRSGVTQSGGVRIPAVALLCSLLVAACGSTVQTTGSALTGPGGTGDGLTAGPGGTGTTGTAGALTPGTTGTTTLPGTPGAPGTTGTTTTGGTTGAAAGTTGALGSRDTSPVTVGFELIQGGNQFIAAGFGTPVNFGDGRREVMAIVNDLNARGGINGHRIKPVFAEWNAATRDAGRQATCGALIDDGHAQFIITVININSALLECTARHGVPLVNASIGAGDDELYRKYGANFYSPALMSLNVESELLLRRLLERKVLARGSKVGVVVDGTDPQYTRVFKQTEEPTLKALGIPYTSYTVAQQADVNSAVLRFRAENIQDVVFIAPNGIIAALFMQSAEQQQYRPTYGMGDSTSAWFAAQAAPPRQVRGFQGVGSLPLSNVEVRQYPTTAREKACLDLIAKAGERNDDRHSSITATVYCEGIYAWAAVARRVVGPITPAAWRAAYAGVGTTYRPVTTFASSFGTGGHANAALYRDLAWSDGCSCVTYLGGLRPIPRF
jgi:ABC-type branched-subunit amino acid transport system substrate-binding protein